MHFYILSIFLNRSMRSIVIVLLQALFRNFNDLITLAFVQPLEKLVKGEKKEEQQLAAEIISGLIEGSRQWSYEKLATLWSWLHPLLISALENITTETANYWTKMVKIKGDLRRNHRLLDLFFSLCEKPTNSSFHTTM